MKVYTYFEKFIFKQMLDTNIISKYTKYTLQYNNMNSSYTKMFRDAFKKQWQNSDIIQKMWEEVNSKLFLKFQERMTS